MADADTTDGPAAGGGDAAARAKFSQADKLLKTEIAEMTTALEKLATDVEATHATHVGLAGDVHALRTEFSGFGEFRERVEGYEKTAKSYFWKGFWAVVLSSGGVVLAIAGGALLLGMRFQAVASKVDELTTTVKEAGETSKALTKDVVELKVLTAQQVTKIDGLDKSLTPSREAASKITNASEKIEQIALSASRDTALLNYVAERFRNRVPYVVAIDQEQISEGIRAFQGKQRIVLKGKLADAERGDKLPRSPTTGPAVSGPGVLMAEKGHPLPPLAQAPETIITAVVSERGPNPENRVDIIISFSDVAAWESFGRYVTSLPALKVYADLGRTAPSQAQDSPPPAPR